VIAVALTLEPTSPAGLRRQIRDTEAALARETDPRRRALYEERLKHLRAWLGR
jgi:hypothetical protein